VVVEFDFEAGINSILPNPNSLEFKHHRNTLKKQSFNEFIGILTRNINFIYILALYFFFKIKDKILKTKLKQQ